MSQLSRCSQCTPSALNSRPAFWSARPGRGPRAHAGHRGDRPEALDRVGLAVPRAAIGRRPDLAPRHRGDERRADVRQRLDVAAQPQRGTGGPSATVVAGGPHLLHLTARPGLHRRKREACRCRSRRGRAALLSRTAPISYAHDPPPSSSARAATGRAACRCSVRRRRRPTSTARRSMRSRIPAATAPSVATYGPCRRRSAAAANHTACSARTASSPRAGPRPTRDSCRPVRQHCANGRRRRSSTRAGHSPRRLRRTRFRNALPPRTRPAGRLDATFARRRQCAQRRSSLRHPPSRARSRRSHRRTTTPRWCARRPNAKARSKS